MELCRRFLFRGHASGVAARIRRPVDRRLPVQAASSLPVTGGLSESKVGPKRFYKYLSFQSAATSALGDFTDPKRAEAMTRGECAPDAISTETIVTAQVRRLEVLGRLSIGVASACLVGRSPDGEGQPPIRPKGIRIEQVKVDGLPLKITLAEPLFVKCATKEMLAAAYAEGLEDRHAGLFCAAGGGAWSSELPESNGLVLCTLVEKMEWGGRAHANARIEGNTLTIPDFGKVYFAEMLVGDYSRRLTLVRIQLGSPEGGDVTASEIETNGSFWP